VAERLAGLDPAAGGHPDRRLVIPRVLHQEQEDPTIGIEHEDARGGAFDRRVPRHQTGDRSARAARPGG